MSADAIRSAGDAGDAPQFDPLGCPLQGTNLVEASAGTGKTWNLSALYLRLLIERELDVSAILVVTFTKAATAELRERIRARIVLARRMLDDVRDADGARGRDGDGPRTDDPFVAALVAAMLDQPGRSREAIARRLEAAAANFDEAAIFTIHGFCQRALAQVPFAAGLPFELTHVADDDDLLREVVHDFWRQRIAAAAPTDALLEAIDAHGDTPEHWVALLERRLSRPLAIERWPDDDGAPPDEALAQAGDTRAQAFAQAVARWPAESPEALARLLGAKGVLNASSYREDAIREGFEGWSLFLSQPDPAARGAWSDAKRDLFRASTIARKTNKSAAGARGGATAAGSPAGGFDLPLFDLLERLRAADEALDALHTRLRLRLLREMLEHCAGEVRRRKRERRLQSFDDMLAGLHQALSDPRYPWLASALRARYPVALIDEFQDTDPVQYGIFQAVYGEPGAGPVFLVGDPKQAIYGFRNADLHVYLKARAAVDARYTLSHNQRAVPPLIAASNRLFGANPGAFVLPGLAYQPVQPGGRRRKHLRDDTEPAGGAALRVWRLPRDASGQPLSRARARQAAIDATAAEVARLLAAARAGRFTLDGGPLAPSQVAVLVRSHAQGADVARALAALGVGSVELSHRSVYRSVDARELLRVLLAVHEPARTPVLLGALATGLMGHTADEVAAIAADEGALLGCVERFARYRATWIEHGFGPMLRQWIAGEGVDRRLIAGTDGERRMTNLLHLGELLQVASVEHPAPDALLRGFAALCADDREDEAAQLRLESDANLVNIVTIHRSKGLEYDVVFCPLLWLPPPPSQGSPEGLACHDDDGRLVIDYGPTRPERDALAARLKTEAAAEEIRLAYVALTRAAQRCYLVAGCYGRATGRGVSFAESAHSLLNWLLGGAGCTLDAWRKRKAGADTPGEIDACWAALVAASAPGELSIVDLPSDAGPRLAVAGVPAAGYRVPEPPALPAAGWRIGSFSSLSHGAAAESAATDHDARVLAATGGGPVVDAALAAVTRLPEDDILAFPRGAAAGDCVHAVFEAADFGRPDTWPDAIGHALARHPMQLRGAGAPRGEAGQSRLAAMLGRMLADVTRTALRGDLALASVAGPDRLTEMPFHLPVAGLTAAELNGFLRAHGYDVPSLRFASLEGYLTGFVDLVFRHAGRYYLLDWKSNHLGDAAADYARPRLARAMAEQGYTLQYLLYLVAVRRLLRARLPGFDAVRDLGGVFYLFVRGVRPGWRDADGQPAGVYFDAPPEATIDALERLLDGEGRA